MSEKPISPLRRRMIEDMMVRNFVEETRNDYIREVRTFTAFLGRFAKYGDTGESSPFSTASKSERCSAAEHEQRGCSTSFLLHHYSRSTRDGAASHLRA